jgi:4-hydroxyphenylacetate 3-monooxygenase
MVQMSTPGIKLICRPSYKLTAAAMGSPFDYPLTSRFDEDDAIFIFDNAFIPRQNVFVHRDIGMKFDPQSGFLNGCTFQDRTRRAVKLEFLVGLVSEALRACGTDEFRGVQVQLGEITGWRNLFWA